MKAGIRRYWTKRKRHIKNGLNNTVYPILNRRILVPACFYGHKGENSMQKLQFDEQQILDTIDRVVKRTMNIDFTWDWHYAVKLLNLRWNIQLYW